MFGKSLVLKALGTSQSFLTNELLTEQLPCPFEHSMPVSTGLCSMTPQFCTHKDCWGLLFLGRGPRGNPWIWPFSVAIWMVKFFFYGISKKRIACSSTIHLHIIHSSCREFVLVVAMVHYSVEHIRLMILAPSIPNWITLSYLSI